MPQKFDSLERSDWRFKREFKDVQHHKEAKIMQSVSRIVFIEMKGCRTIPRFWCGSGYM